MLLKQSMLIKSIESQVHGWGWITVTEHGMLNATQPKQPSHQTLQCFTLPPSPTITSTLPPGQSLQFRTYNSRRLSVWKSCQESVVSRLLDKFLQKLTNKGVVKGQSQQYERPPWRTWSPGGRLWCTYVSSPNFAKDKPAKN